MEFKVNPDHNYYSCPVARPNSQLFLVRLEWEAESSDTTDEVDKTMNNDGKINDTDDEDDQSFTLAMINFSGMDYILVGLDRNNHEKVLSIADELDLKIVPGYPLSRSQTDRKDTKNTDVIKHFPIRCAADSIFTVEGKVNINDPAELMIRKHKECQMVNAYLEVKYKEMEAELLPGERDEEQEKYDIELQP
jgi:hypothetical protein